MWRRQLAFGLYVIFDVSIALLVEMASMAPGSSGEVYANKRFINTLTELGNVDDEELMD